MDNFNEITFIPVMLTKKTSSFNLAKKKNSFQSEYNAFCYFFLFFSSSYSFGALSSRQSFNQNNENLKPTTMRIT